jgi:DNA-directed RNA polymerase subunit B'
MTDIFLDGRYIGSTNEPEKVVKMIRENRRNGTISEDINVVYLANLDEIRILSDSGRVRRPLIVVENGKPKLTEEHIKKLERKEIKWSDLVKQGIIEFLDADEEENTGRIDREAYPSRIGSFYYSWYICLFHPIC